MIGMNCKLLVQSGSENASRYKLEHYQDVDEMLLYSRTSILQGVQADL